jgi:hypothetical protein
MRLNKTTILSFSLATGFALLLIMFGLLRMPESAQAQARPMPISLVPPMQAKPDYTFTVVLTDPVPIQITDLSGNVVGEGVSEGELRCNGDNCTKSIDLNVQLFNPPVGEPSSYLLEYKFSSRQAFDLEAERVVVAGTGTKSSDRSKERFSFTATFRNNRDGTLSVTYAASRPDASFVVPEVPGTFEVRTR